MSALLISAINTISGFVLAKRMLNLFCKVGMKDWSWFIAITRVLRIAMIIADADWEEIGASLMTEHGVGSLQDDLLQSVHPSRRCPGSLIQVEGE